MWLCPWPLLAFVHSLVFHDLALEFMPVPQWPASERAFPESPTEPFLYVEEALLTLQLSVSRGPGNASRRPGPSLPKLTG